MTRIIVRIMVIFAALFLFNIESATAQRRDQQEIVSIRAGQTKSVQLKGASNANFTGVRAMLSGKSPTKTDLIRVSLGPQTRSGRELKITATKNARTGQTFVVQGLNRRGKEASMLPYNIRIVTAGNSDSPKKNTDDRRRSTNNRSDKKG